MASKSKYVTFARTKWKKKNLWYLHFTFLLGRDSRFVQPRTHFQVLRPRDESEAHHGQKSGFEGLCNLLARVSAISKKWSDGLWRETTHALGSNEPPEIVFGVWTKRLRAPTRTASKVLASYYWRSKIWDSNFGSKEKSTPGNTKMASQFELVAKQKVLLLKSIDFQNQKNNLEFNFNFFVWSWWRAFLFSSKKRLIFRWIHET